MTIEKYLITKESSNFTILPNLVLQNLKDPLALAIWVYLSSLPPEWEIYKDQIQTHFGIGRDKLKTIWSTLKHTNLLEVTSRRDSSGQIIGWKIHIKNGTNFTGKNPPQNNNDADFHHKTEIQFNQETEIQSCGEKNQKTKKPAGGETAPIKDISINKKEIIKPPASFFEKNPENQKPQKLEADKPDQYVKISYPKKTYPKKNFDSPTYQQSTYSPNKNQSTRWDPTREARQNNVSPLLRHWEEQQKIKNENHGKNI